MVCAGISRVDNLWCSDLFCTAVSRMLSPWQKQAKFIARLYCSIKKHLFRWIPSNKRDVIEYKCTNMAIKLALDKLLLQEAKRQNSMRCLFRKHAWSHEQNKNSRRFLEAHFLLCNTTHVMWYRVIFHEYDWFQLKSGPLGASDFNNWLF